MDILDQSITTSSEFSTITLRTYFLYALTVFAVLGINILMGYLELGQPFPLIGSSIGWITLISLFFLTFLLYKKVLSSFLLLLPISIVGWTTGDFLAATLVNKVLQVNYEFYILVGLLVASVYVVGTLTIFRMLHLWQLRK